MCHVTDADHFTGDGPAKQPGPVFGHEEFWRKAYAQHGRQFDAVDDLVRLGDEMAKAADEKADESVKKVICALTRATISGACEAVVLCGNGLGPGAMKIVRGMYESRWTAEYLRRHPGEVEDYLEFSKVLRWRRIRWLVENRPSEASALPPNVRKQVEEDYNQAKARFTNAGGRVRDRWHKKPIRQIAEDIGGEKEYELPYTIACSIHHGNFEGLSAAFSLKDGVIVPDPPPSVSWVEKALVAARTNLWFALNTLNDACALSFADKLNMAPPDSSEGLKE